MKGTGKKRRNYFEELIESEPALVLDQILTFIEEENNYSKKQIQDIVKNQLEAYVPISIFSGKLTTLEALIVFLRDKRGFGTKKISTLINRSPACISITYSRAKKKAFLPEQTLFGLKIPLKVFRSPKFSAQEALVKYLLDKGLPLRQVSKSLAIDSRTAWTIKHRIIKKEMRWPQ